MEIPFIMRKENAPATYSEPVQERVCLEGVGKDELGLPGVLLLIARDN